MHCFFGGSNLAFVVYSCSFLHGLVCQIVTRWTEMVCTRASHENQTGVRDQNLHLKR